MTQNTYDAQSCVNSILLINLKYLREYHTGCFIINWKNLYKRANNTVKITVFPRRISRIRRIAEIHSVQRHFWRLEWVGFNYSKHSMWRFWIKFQYFLSYIYKLNKKNHKVMETCNVPLFVAKLNFIFWINTFIGELTTSSKLSFHSSISFGLPW